MTELYRKYRPQKLSEIVGQPEAVSTIQGLLKNGLPHAILLSGDSGVGKSTLAQIMAREIGCSDLNLQMVNCAIVEPLERIRAIERDYRLRPMGKDKARVFILEELQAMSRAGFAQQAMLTMLEECPTQTFFFATTTDPKKIIEAIRTRCTIIALKALSDKDIALLVSKVAKVEKAKLTQDVLERLVELSLGSARRALVLLEKVLAADKKEESQLTTLGQGIGTLDPFKLVEVLMPFRGQPVWKAVVSTLKNLENEDPESIRRLILSCVKSRILKNPQDAIAVRTWHAFRDNFYDTLHTGLVLACREVVFGRKQ